MKKKLLLVFFLMIAIVLSACDGTFEFTIGNIKQTNGHPPESNELVDGLEVHFIDVGQGDAILMRTDETTILVDAGDWKGEEVVPYLKSQGVDTIDLAIGTHEHADHIGQLDDVLTHFHVEEVWLSGNEHTSQTYERVLRLIYEKDVVYHEPHAGETYDIKDIVLEVYNPSELTGQYNNDSIVVKAVYGDVSFMLTGDVEKKAEDEMLHSGDDLNATILKVAHHGSNTSSTEPFVKAVNPKVAIMSYGEDNSYYHPHQSVLDTFDRMGVEMYGTAAHGTIIVRTDGDAYHIETEKDGVVTQGGG